MDPPKCTRKTKMMVSGLEGELFKIYLGDRPNSSGGYKAAATARERIGWVRFRKCEELLLGNRFPLRVKLY